MKAIDFSGMSFYYLNLLIKRYNKGKLSKVKFLKLQEQLYLWSMNELGEEVDDFD